MTLIAGVLGGGACGSGGASVDAAVDEAGPDGGLEAVVRPPTCDVSQTICVNNDVYMCVAQQQDGAQQPGDLVAICDDACSFGRCTTAACRDAEQSDGARGCRFYAVQVDNIDREVGKNMMLIVTNASKAPATVQVQTRDSTGHWVLWSYEIVQGEGSTRMAVNRPTRGAGRSPGNALRIESDVPISVTELVSDDQDHDSTSSGGTVLLPMHALGTKHFAITAPEIASLQEVNTLGSRDAAGAITIVGTVDGTTLKVKLTAPAVVGSGAIVGPDDGLYEIALDEGDVEQIFSAAPAADLSGTSVSSNYPVAFFSGNVYTSYGFEMSGLNGADLALEQLPPVESWVKEYVAAYLGPQKGCESFWGKYAATAQDSNPLGVGYFQVIASEDNTTVTVQSGEHTTFSFVQPSDAPMSAGESRTLYAIPDRTFVLIGLPSPPPDLVIHGNNPILVAQWFDCEPALSLALVGRFVTDRTLMAFPPNVDLQLVIARSGASPVSINGSTISDGFFSSSVGGYQLARISGSDLAQFAPCIESSDACRHYIDGAVGITWRGMDVVCSYAVTVPSSDGCHLPGVPCTK